MSFCALQVSLKLIYITFGEKPDKLLRAGLKKKSFPFVGKDLEQLENRQILCFHRPNFSYSSVGPGYKLLMNEIQCIYSNLFDRLYVKTSQ